MGKIELAENFVLVESEDLKEQLEMYDKEKAYYVEKNNEVKGSVSIWKDGTINYFDYKADNDFDIKDLEEIIEICQ